MIDFSSFESIMKEYSIHYEKEMETNMPIIGIDLGTTNSLVSCYVDGECRLIPNAFEEYLTPSVVSVHPSRPDCRCFQTVHGIQKDILFGPI